MSKNITDLYYSGLYHGVSVARTVKFLQKDMNVLGVSRESLPYRHNLTVLFGLNNPSCTAQLYALSAIHKRHETPTSGPTVLQEHMFSECHLGSHGTR